MNIKDIGTVIATRELDLDTGGKVKVTIGMPKNFSDGKDYYCPYQIEGLQHRRISYAGGIDAVQALQLAMNCIATDLYTSDEFKSDRLRHLGMKNLGFPGRDVIADLIPPENE